MYTVMQSNNSIIHFAKILRRIHQHITYKGLSLQVQFNYNYGNYVIDNWYFYTSSDGLYLGIFNQMLTS